MINPEEAKKIDPELCALSDDDLKALIEAMYETTNLGFDIWWTEKSSKNPVGLFLEKAEKDKI